MTKNLQTKTNDQLSKAAMQVIKNFRELPLGKKRVVTPYFMNIKGQRGGLRVMIGKGDPDEIVQEVKVWAQVKGFNLKKAEPDQVRQFMIDQGIGIDCSGFVVYVLNAELKSRGYGSIWNYIKHRKNSILSRIKRILRPVENIGAELLTSDLNCIKVENLNDVRPADLIRAKGKVKNSHHVAIITQVERDDTGEIKAFEYAHSHRYYDDQNGIRIGRVEITNINGELKDQKWIDDYNGKNYMLEDLLEEYEDNGIRRLKIFS